MTCTPAEMRKLLGLPLDESAARLLAGLELGVYDEAIVPDWVDHFALVLGSDAPDAFYELTPLHLVDAPRLDSLLADLAEDASPRLHAFDMLAARVLGKQTTVSGAAFAALRWVPEDSALRTPIFRIAARAAEQEWEAPRAASDPVEQDLCEALLALLRPSGTRSV